MEKINNAFLNKTYNFNGITYIIVNIGELETIKDFFGNEYQVCNVTVGSSEDNFKYARYTDIEIKNGKAMLMVPGSEINVLDEIEF